MLHPKSYSIAAVGAGTSFVPSGNISWTDAQYDGKVLLRKTAWCTLGKDCTCNYEYSDTNQGRVTDEKMLAAVRGITAAVAAVTGLGSLLNSVNLNYYPTGGGVGFHADDEELFDGLARDTAIVSLSLCEENGRSKLGARRFEVRLKRAFVEGSAAGQEPKREEIVAVELQHGDIMTMEGLHQLFYLHSVWPGDADGQEFQGRENLADDGVGYNVTGARINLTWRNIVAHQESCPCRQMESRGKRRRL
eukprot:TRINITY_DN49127_c0_g1_i1.p1 TRINITY_DN49127_c0_g1~~TRINITY_DN49127_c0_g1_i1.p1  ORF type:complete len:248 (+),score=52.10 TRINITY_DN49127_c0_g1_i1:54-797(+)